MKFATVDVHGIYSYPNGGCSVYVFSFNANHFCQKKKNGTIKLEKCTLRSVSFQNDLQSIKKRIFSITNKKTKKGQLVRRCDPWAQLTKQQFLTMCQWKKCATITAVWNLKRKMCQEVSNVFYFMSVLAEKTNSTNQIIPAFLQKFCEVGIISQRERKSWSNLRLKSYSLPHIVKVQ